VVVVGLTVATNCCHHALKSPSRAPANLSSLLVRLACKSESILACYQNGDFFDCRITSGEQLYCGFVGERDETKSQSVTSMSTPQPAPSVATESWWRPRMPSGARNARNIQSDNVKGAEIIQYA
jgi:hypothetical protein